MALSDSQKFDVIRLLGWPGKTLVEGSTQYSNVIAGRLTGLHAEIENDVAKLLKRVKGLDEKLDKALGRASAIEIDGIKLNPDEMNLLRGERSKVVRELSELLDIPNNSRGGVNFSVIS
jgi:hypothetical protein